LPFEFRSNARILAVVLLAGTLVGCAHGQKMPAVGQADADKFLYERGSALLAKKSWITAREYFRRIVDSYPQSTYRADAKLGVGDSYIGENQSGSLILAVNEFREFLTYFPLSARADYAQYKLALATSKQMLSAERDQTATHETLTEVQKFIDTYPDSQYRAEVDKVYRQARDRLSESEFKVGMVYYRARYMIGALPRFADVLRDDPGYTRRDEVLYFAGVAFTKAGLIPQAVPMFATVVQQYPKSKYAKSSKRYIEQLTPKPAAGEVKR
jgi:outer membrane protein assembly factor BamD